MKINTARHKKVRKIQHEKMKECSPQLKLAHGFMKVKVFSNEEDIRSVCLRQLKHARMLAWISYSCISFRA